MELGQHYPIALLPVHHQQLLVLEVTIAVADWAGSKG